MRRFALWEQEAGKQQMDPTPHALVLPDTQAAALLPLLELQEENGKKWTTKNKSNGVATRERPAPHDQTAKRQDFT